MISGSSCQPISIFSIELFFLFSRISRQPFDCCGYRVMDTSGGTTTLKGHSGKRVPASEPFDGGFWPSIVSISRVLRVPVQIKVPELCAPQLRSGLVRSAVAVGVGPESETAFEAE